MHCRRLAAAVAWSYRRSGTPLAVLCGVLIVPGMLLPYTAQSFGEPLAVAAFGALVLAALRCDQVSKLLASPVSWPL